MIPNTDQLRSSYKNAPQAVQEYITSAELNAVFEELRTKYQLHLDEAGNLSNALNAVFLELVPFEKFPELLKEAIKGDDTKQTAILKEINERVFVVFRKKLQSEGGTGEEKETAEKEVASGDRGGKIIEESRQGGLVPPLSTMPSTQGAPAPQTTTTEQTRGIKKLEQTVKETPVEIQLTPSVSNETATQKKEVAPKGPSYSGTDPYREPVE